MKKIKSKDIEELWVMANRYNMFSKSSMAFALHHIKMKLKELRDEE